MLNQLLTRAIASADPVLSGLGKFIASHTVAQPDNQSPDQLLLELWWSATQGCISRYKSDSKERVKIVISLARKGAWGTPRDYDWPGHEVVLAQLEALYPVQTGQAASRDERGACKAAAVSMPACPPSPPARASARELNFNSEVKLKEFNLNFRVPASDSSPASKNSPERGSQEVALAALARISARLQGTGSTRSSQRIGHAMRVGECLAQGLGG